MATKAASFFRRTASVGPDSKEQLAKWFRPIVHFHPKETIWPCSFDDYMDNCFLRNRVTGEVLERKVNSAVLKQYNRDPLDRQVCLDCDPSFWTQRPKDLNQVPIYCRVDSSDSIYHWLQYWMIYPYNGALSIGCFTRPDCCPSNKAIAKAGAHQADVEHLSMYVEKSTNRIAKVYLSAHGDADGQWFNEQELLLQNGGRTLNVYSAYQSHAVYDHPGCIPRVFGCANDFTSDEGVAWESEQVILLERDWPEWQLYVGGIGFPDSGDVPANKESWTKEPSLSATKWSRIFRYLNCCCCQPEQEDPESVPPVPQAASLIR